MLFGAIMTSRQSAPRVLIVDDEPEIRAFMSDALDIFGYQVGAAGNAAEAFALVARTRFDLGMSDLRLPWWTGRDFVSRAGSRDPTLRLIMVAGSVPADAD